MRISRRSKSWAYVDRNGSIRTAMDLDPIALADVLGELDPGEAPDPHVAPWKRRHVAMLRATFAD